MLRRPVETAAETSHSPVKLMNGRY